MLSQVKYDPVLCKSYFQYLTKQVFVELVKEIPVFKCGLFIDFMMKLIRKNTEEGLVDKKFLSRIIQKNRFLTKCEH